MYPSNWPRCICGDYALDGKATCGRSDCLARLGGPRSENEDPYQYAHRRGQFAAERGGDWRDNPHTPGTREWFEFEDGLSGS